MQGSFLDCKHWKTETINIYTMVSPAQCSFSGWAFGGTNRYIKSCWIPSCNIYSLMITKRVYQILWIVSMQHQNQKTCEEAKLCDIFPLPLAMQWPGPFLVLPIFIRSNLEGMMQECVTEWAVTSCAKDCGLKRGEKKALKIPLLCCPVGSQKCDTEKN